MLVLIPGLACTSELFAPQLPSLWKFGHVMIANHARHKTMDSLARDILAHAPAEFALAGLSMGGYAALEIMHQAPERVKRLALLDTSARPDTPEATANRRAQIEAARAGHYDEVIRGAGPALFHSQDEKLFQKFFDMAHVVGPQGFENQQEAIISRADSRPLLASIKCPTLVLCGANDKLTPPPVAHELHEGIRGSRYVEIPDCGHASSVEQPTAVTKALVEWLS